MNGRRRLESWKEIADYLGRSGRTAHRWHVQRGMPVHREAGGLSDRVYAWADEIDQWRNGLDLTGETAENGGPTGSGQPVLSSGLADAGGNGMEPAPKSGQDLRAVPEDAGEAREAGPRLDAHGAGETEGDPGAGPAAGRDRSGAPATGRWSRFRRWGLAAAAVAGAALLVLAAGRFLLDRPAEGGELYFEIIPFAKGSWLHVYNTRQQKLLTLRADIHDFRGMLVEFQRQLTVLKPADLDGDGLEDLVYASHYPIRPNRLSLYRRVDFDTLRLEREWPLDWEFRYDGETFTDFGCLQLETGELDGDGRPEIVVFQNSHPNYPALLRAFGQDGGTRLRLVHPGRIRNIALGDRDGDGRSEIYAAATNNFLGRGNSVPVLLAVTPPPGKEFHELSFFGPGQTLPAAVPEGFRVVYVQFPFDPLVPGLEPWQSARLRGFFPARRSYLEVYASIYSERDFYNRSVENHYRVFYFDRSMACLEAFWRQDHLDAAGIHSVSGEMRRLLVPRYWNGAGWQEPFCEVPRARSR